MSFASPFDSFSSFVSCAYSLLNSALLLSVTLIYINFVKNKRQGLWDRGDVCVCVCTGLLYLNVDRSRSNFDIYMHM